MFLVSIKKSLAVGFLVCTFVELSVARDIPVGIGKNHDFTLTCKAGNFTGVIEGTAGRHFQTGKWVHTKRYKITRINGQSGGNKANVNLSAGKAPNFDRGNMVYSPDRMIQDGKWHDLNLVRQNLAVGNARVEAFYEFIFDKSGPDPRCWTEAIRF